MVLLIVTITATVEYKHVPSNKQLTVKRFTK